MVYEWHGAGSTNLECSQLTSHPNCPQQRLHFDNLDKASEKKRKQQKKRKYFDDIPFSILIALEVDSNVTALLNHDGDRLVIKQGCMAVWRGDYYHGGAEYSVLNRRLHIAVGDVGKVDTFHTVTFKP